MYNIIGQRVKGRYFTKFEFIGTIISKTCVNNGAKPAYMYCIKLDQPYQCETFGLTETIAFIDRDQRAFNNELEGL